MNIGTKNSLEDENDILINIDKSEKDTSTEQIIRSFWFVTFLICVIYSVIPKNHSIVFLLMHISELMDV